MKDGRDWESHQQNPTQDTAQGYHLSRDATRHHVSIANSGHGDHSPPVAGGDACEFLLGSQFALSQVHQRWEECHGDAKEEQEQPELPGAPAHSEPQRLQPQRVPCQPHHVQDAQSPQEAQHQAHSFQVLVPSSPTGLAAVFCGGCIHNERDIERQDGQDVDDVEWGFQKSTLVLCLDGSQEELKWKPRHAHCLQHKDVIALLWAFTLGRRGLGNTEKGG